MKKKGIFYILFAFLIMFGLKANVFAEGDDLFCVYKVENAKEALPSNNGDYFALSLYDDKWKVRRLYSSENETYYSFSGNYSDDDYDYLASSLNTEVFECPKNIYAILKNKDSSSILKNIIGNINIGPSFTLEQNEKFNVGNLKLLSFPQKICSYSDENKSSYIQLIRSSSGVLANPFIVSGNAGIVSSFKGNASLSKIKVPFELDNGSCYKALYIGDNISNDESKAGSSSQKWNLISNTNFIEVDKNGNSSEGGNSFKSLACTYTDGSNDYILSQGYAGKITFVRLFSSDKGIASSKYIVKNNSLDSFLLDPSNGVRLDYGTKYLDSCPRKLFADSSKYITNNSTGAIKTFTATDSIVCITAQSGTYKNGSEGYYYVKTRNGLYTASTKLVNSSGVINNLKNFKFDEYKFFNSSASQDKKAEDICGKVEVSDENGFIRNNFFNIAFKNKGLNEEGICKYGDIQIKLNYKNKKFSVVSSNSCSNGIDVSRVGWSDVSNSVSAGCNYDSKFKIDNCKLVKNSNGSSIDQNYESDKKNDLKEGESSVVKGNIVKKSSYKQNRTYYKPICGLFKKPDDGGKLFNYILNAYKIVKVVVPVLVVILTIIEFLKVLFSGEDKTMKDAFKATTTRFILIAVLIFVPVIVEFVIKISGVSENCLQYFVK